MAKYENKRRFSPALFDLPQDISRGLPMDIVGEWIKSDLSQNMAMNILKPTTIIGTSVSSDSAGLTKLSSEKSLIEVLAMINRPKEIVHSFGSAIGGKDIGVWAADNTQMWYPAEIETDKIVSMLLAVQEKICKECEVKIGLGAHFGSFYNIGGGLYGQEADWIENIAENHTEGGEIVISHSLKSRLKNKYKLKYRPEISSVKQKIFKVEDGPKLVIKKNDHHTYPIPYSEKFYADLMKYGTKSDSALLRKIESKYTKLRAVVLVERQTEEAESHQVSLLNNLSYSVEMRRVGNLLLANKGIEVKISGPLGIFIFEKCSEAVSFAKSFRKILLDEYIETRIGIDFGPLMVFDLKDGGMDVAGMPVNIASKLSQDFGELGKIYLTENVAKETSISGFKKIKFKTSKIDLPAYVSVR